MDRHILFGFTNVDQSADPDYFIRFLDTASSEESFQGYKRRSFSLLEIKSGQRILELGGGTGDDARALAAPRRSRGRKSTASITARPWSMKPGNVLLVRDYPSFFTGGDATSSGLRQQRL